MPYELMQDGGKWCLVKSGTKLKVKGSCHTDKAETEAMMRALYANEKKAQEVELEITESLSIIRMLDAETAELKGVEWEVTVVGPESASDLVTVDGKACLKSKNGRYYTLAALEASAPLWNMVKVYDNHLTDAQFEASQGMRSVVKDWVGVIVNPRWDAAAKSVKATLKIVDETLRAKLLAAHQAKVLDAIGLSIDAFVEGVKKTIGGVEAQIISKFVKTNSVDIVANPAAGGRLTRAVAGDTEDPARPGPTILEEEMNEEELKRLIAEALAAHPGISQEALQVMVSQAVKEALAAAPKPTGQEDGGATAAILKQAQEVLAEAKRQSDLLVCREMLSTKLADSGLPVSFRKLVQGQFEGRTFEEKELDAAIKAQGEALTPVIESGRVILPEGSRLSVSPVSEMDRFELGFMRLVMGQTRFGELMTEENARYHNTEAVRAYVKAGKPSLPFTSRLSEWYYDFTNDYDAQGIMARRATEGQVLSTTVTSIVKNALNLMLAADYSVRQRWWEPIVRNEDVDTLDQATLVRVFGMSTLATIAENAPYNELTWADEEETAAYVKKGNYIGVSLETFLLDKLSVLRSIPNRLSNAWYNTISKLVSGVFTLNTAAGPVLADTGALFNATAVATAGGHVNLLTAALSPTALTAVRLAMRKQTDQPLGAGERLSITPRHILIPADLESTATQIATSELEPGTYQNATTFMTNNIWKGKIEPIIVPHFTDANDWAAVADPALFPAIWLIWLRGRRSPEIFSAEEERGGAMFTNDELRFKTRMFTFRFSSSYDCAPVSDFRPLHKSNV